MNLRILPFILLMATAALAQAQNCVPPPSSLTAWWAGEGDGRDFAGTNKGMVIGGVAFVPGEVGHAFSFDGSGNYVKILSAPSVDVGLSAGFTVEAWIRPANVEDGPIVEWVQPSVLQVHFYVGSGYSGGLYAAVFGTDGNSHIIQSPGGLLVSNQFQHVALTYDKSSGTGRLLLNGVVVQEALLGTFTPRTTGDLYIGYRPATTPFGPRVFTGAIDEVTLYNRALSAAELLAIFNAGTAGKCAPPTPPWITIQPRSQIGYWGQDITFMVMATGSPPLAYLWYKDSFPITWATNSTLVLTNLSLQDGGNYSVVVTNAYGSATSSAALLTVNPAGVSLGLYAGVTIAGTPGKTYGIQYATNVSLNPTWLTLTQFTLLQPVQLWFDTNVNVAAAINPQRFYRVVAIP